MTDSAASSSCEQPAAAAAVATAKASSPESPKPPASAVADDDSTPRGPLHSNTSSVNTPPAQPQYGDQRSSSVMSSSGGHGPPTTMNMREMRAALPGSGHQSQQPLPFDPQQQYHRHMQHMHHNVQVQFAVPSPGMFYPVHPHPSYQGGESADGRRTAYPVPYAPLYPQYFAHHQQQPSYPTFSPAFIQPPSSSHTFPVYGQTTAGYGVGYPPTPYPMVVGQGQGQGQGPSTIPRGYAQSGPQYGKQPTHVRPDGPRKHNSKSAASHDDGSMTIVDGSAAMKSGSEPRASVSPPSVTTASTTPGAPRRTPKQSGHALWVGNLPPGTSIVELKDHFSQGMSDDIESVFLISKSNCAFINYKTEAACSAAQAKFHDSRFQGVRLVCRLRRGVVPNGSPTSGERGSGSPVKSEGYDSPNRTSASEKSASDAGDIEHEQQLSSSLERVPNRYFIVKSLTIDDLEASRQSGIWATQTHNEVNLNRAYDAADNVYLIFSANKSGEYYGYARMVSPIQEDEKLALEMPPRTNHIQLLNTSETAEPNVTVTQASAIARSGRIIDDPARGTIFWEADPTEEEDNAAAGSSASLTDGEDTTEDITPTSTTTTTTTRTTTTQSQTIGRPFRIQWLSTERVPFHRTRGLRNPWNANRGVKIARDGTEIEPSVGAQVVELFHIPTNATMAYRIPN